MENGPSFLIRSIASKGRHHTEWAVKKLEDPEKVVWCQFLVPETVAGWRFLPPESRTKNQLHFAFG
mgnify:CR=1 FL=1